MEARWIQGYLSQAKLTLVEKGYTFSCEFLHNSYSKYQNHNRYSHLLAASSFLKVPRKTYLSAHLDCLSSAKWKKLKSTPKITHLPVTHWPTTPALHHLLLNVKVTNLQQLCNVIVSLWTKTVWEMVLTPFLNLFNMELRQFWRHKLGQNCGSNKMYFLKCPVNITDSCEINLTLQSDTPKKKQRIEKTVNNVIKGARMP